MRETRIGGWLPADRQVITDWVNGLIQKLEADEQKDEGHAGLLGKEKVLETGKLKHDSVREFKQLLDTDPRLHLLAMQMIEQGLDYSKKDPTGRPEIRSYQMMARLIDHIIGCAPEYMPKGAAGGGLIGFPINAIVDWCMGTPAGYAFFLDKQVNGCLERILKEWCTYLSSEASCDVLHTDKGGWLCEEALEELKIEDFVCSPDAPHYGFKSWNDFFTRKFKDGKRPVAGREDPYVIVSACESAPYRISTNVQTKTKFWLKGQPYSLEYMLDHDPDAEKFIGGTVYQAFLSATKYHRWHSPVSGKIVRCKLVPGTYYAEVSSYPYDDAGPNNSQGYITHVAARAVIMIESDNPDIGLMAFIAVGMAEVSSCCITVQEGAHVEKGDELGYFQFGGSTHCLIFQQDVIDMFVQDAIPAEDFNDSSIVRVCSKLAVAKRKSK